MEERRTTGDLAEGPSETNGNAQNKLVCAGKSRKHRHKRAIAPPPPPRGGGWEGLARQLS